MPKVRAVRDPVILRLGGRTIHLFPGQEAEVSVKELEAADLKRKVAKGKVAISEGGSK